MQGIRTSRHGAFAIRASCQSKTIIVGRQDALGHDEQHHQAALKLATIMGWKGNWVGATIPKVKGIVWVCCDETIPERIFEVTEDTADGL